MNIHDLPIPNFGELSDEDALKLILEVRSRRRVTRVSVDKPKRVKSPSAGTKMFNTPFGKFTQAELTELIKKLKA